MEKGRRGGEEGEEGHEADVGQKKQVGRQPPSNKKSKASKYLPVLPIHLNLISMDSSAFLINGAIFPPVQIHMQARPAVSRTHTLTPAHGQNHPTDYAQFVLDVLARMTRDAGAIDQTVLRRAIGLASSYLITDASTNPEGGIATWQTGFNRLVDVVVVLHHRGELELDTFNEASKACSECWSVAGTWRGMEECRVGVKEVAGKLKKLLDEPGRRTYQGHKVYTPNSQ